MSTQPTTTQVNLTSPSTDPKNKIRSKNLYNSTIIKFCSSLLFFLSLNLHQQYGVSLLLLFLVLQSYEIVDMLNFFFYYFEMKKAQIRFKKKKIFMRIAISFFECLYFTALLIIVKFDYHIYTFSNTILLVTLLFSLFTLYQEKGQLESLKLLQKLSLLARIFSFCCSLFVCLKLDNILTWNWVTTFWSLWAVFACLVGFAAGFLVASFSKFVQYMFDTQSVSKTEIVMQFWAFLLALYAAVTLGLTSFGMLDVLDNNPDLKNNFLTLDFILIGSATIILLYSLYFRQIILEQIFNILQDDEPLQSQQYSVNIQASNQTLQNINPASSRTQIPSVVQKISKTYFGIPKLKDTDTNTISGSPVLKKSSAKGHKRAFSSQGVASQMFQDLDYVVKEKDKDKTITPQISAENNKIQLRRSNSQFVIHEEANQQPKAELSLSQTSNVCIVCYERGPNAVFMNCGHGGTCYECAVDIWKQKSICYLCREKIVYILKVSLEDRFGDIFKVVSTTQMIDQFNK